MLRGFWKSDFSLRAGWSAYCNEESEMSFLRLLDLVRDEVGEEYPMGQPREIFPVSLIGLRLRKISGRWPGRGYGQ